MPTHSGCPSGRDCRAPPGSRAASPAWRVLTAVHLPQGGKPSGLQRCVLTPSPAEVKPGPRESPQGIPACVSSRVGPLGSVCSHWKQKCPAKVLRPLAKWIPRVFSRQIRKCTQLPIQPPGSGPHRGLQGKDSRPSAPQREKSCHTSLTLNPRDPTLTTPRPGAQGLFGHQSRHTRSQRGRHRRLRGPDLILAGNNLRRQVGVCQTLGGRNQ